LAEEGKFKKDLLDRLSFEVLTLPPLRERREDILLLSNHFAVHMGRELGWEESPRFSKEAIRSLQRYEWPGNVRELKNVVERAIYRSESVLITDIDFNPFQQRVGEKNGNGDISPVSRGKKVPFRDFVAKPFKEAVRLFEVQLLREGLIRAKYNQQKAARELGLSYDQFRGIYRKYKKELEES
jgi:psp operon transcriptional activator